MSSRKFLLILLAAVFVIGAVGSAYGYGSYLTPLSAACPGTSCESCHPAGGPPPFTTYGTAFSGISSHSSNPSGAIATLGCPGGTPAPVACTGYTYSAWSPATCPTSGQQTRTVIGNTPSGCTGTPSTSPVLTQTCTPAPVACTGYTYSAWSACSNGQQTRTVTGNTPAGCAGTPSTAAVLTQACTEAPVACSGYAYSGWSACGSNGQQTRTVTGNTPAGCTGTPSTTAVLTQACNYVPPVTPPPTNGTMPVPTSEMVFSYEPVEQPAVSSDPSQAKPIGVGPVATGGDTADVTVEVGPFAGPVNVSFMIYAPTLESDDLYFMTSGKALKRLSRAVEEEEQSDISDQSHDSDDDHDGSRSAQPSGKFGRLVRWKDNVTGVSENIFTAPVEDLQSGLYVLVLVVKSAEEDHKYYRWITHINIP